MPVSSLPAKYGIGDFGKCAFDFVDFLSVTKQTCWQVLPLNPTSYGDSPYQSPAACAGNPYFIDIELLITEGLLSKEEFESFDFGNNPHKVEYTKFYGKRLELLKLAFKRFNKNEAYDQFLNENAFWLDDYALFMAIKSLYKEAGWLDWPQTLRRRDKDALKEIEKTQTRERTWEKDKIDSIPEGKSSDEMIKELYNK